LGKKRALQLKAIASRLRIDLGNSPAKRLRTLSAEDAYQYLRTLPGVGPKSALCVMMYSLDFDVFPVDVHARRIFERIGLARGRLKHYQAQEQFPGFVPEGMSKELHVALILHGRKICMPRVPDCANCLIATLCKTGRAFKAAHLSRRGVAQRVRPCARADYASTSEKAGK
jgi:endonuclease III